MAATGLHISISAERLFTIGGMGFTNSMLTSLIVSGLLILFAVWVRLSLKKTDRPTGVQNFAEFIIESLYNLVQSVTENKRRTNDFFPFVVSFFFIILCNNWFGLLPGVGSISVRKGEEAQLPSLQQFVQKQLSVRAATPELEETAGHPSTSVQQSEVPAAQAEHLETAEPEEVPLFRAGTADLNTTLALGLMSMVLVQFFGFKYLHLHYLQKFFNFTSPINTFVGILELVSDVSKVMSFAFRLFGNVFAGEVLLTVMTFLTKIIVPMPFYGLEFFVGFIQALVFAMLSVVLFNMATLGHGEEL